MEKPPSVEKPKQPRFKTLERTVREVLPTGESVEEVLECNGIHHRRCVDEISYDESGEIVFVRNISQEDLGECPRNH